MKQFLHDLIISAGMFVLGVVIYAIYAASRMYYLAEDGWFIAIFSLVALGVVYFVGHKRAFSHRWEEAPLRWLTRTAILKKVLDDHRLKKFRVCWARGESQGQSPFQYTTVEDAIAAFPKLPRGYKIWVEGFIGDLVHDIHELKAP